MAEINKLSFASKWPAISAMLEREGIELSEILLKGVVDSRLVGIWSDGVAPWDTNVELSDALAADPVLKYALSTRSMKRGIVNGKDSIGTFGAGNLAVNKLVAKRDLPLRASNGYIPWGKQTAALAFKVVCSIMREVTAENILAQSSAVDSFDVTDIAHKHDSYFRSLIGAGTEHYRVTSAGVEKGKVFAFAVSSGGYGDMDLDDEDTLKKLTVSQFNNSIAADARYAALIVNTTAGRTTVGKANPRALAQSVDEDGVRLTTDGGLYTATRYQVAIVYEVPPHDGPTDPVFYVDRDFYSFEIPVPNPRYTTERAAGVTVRETANVDHIAQLYGDIEVLLNGSMRRVTEVPAGLIVNDAHVGKTFHTLIGFPPQADFCFVGTDIVNDVQAFVNNPLTELTVSELYLQINRAWLSNYHTGAFGRKLKPLASDRLNAEWTEELGSYLCLSYLDDVYTLSRDDVLNLPLAQRYRKAREDACKTNNFMSLDYIQGKTYTSLVNSIQTRGGSNLFASFSDLQVTEQYALTEFVKEYTGVTKSGTIYTLTSSDGVVESIDLSLENSEIELEDFQSNLMLCYVNGLTLPSAWKTDFSIGEDVLAELEEQRLNAYGGDNRVVMFSGGTFLSSSSYTANLMPNAISLNGFYPKHRLVGEVKTQALLYTEACTRKSAQSMMSIMKQFLNSNLVNLV